MEKFEIGDRVRHEACSQDEIVEHIDTEGSIKGRYCNSGDLAGVYANPGSYKMVEKGSSELKNGDTVEVVKPCNCSYWDDGSAPCAKEVLGYQGKITGIDDSGKERPYVVTIPGSCCSFRKDQLKLIKRGEAMSKYDEFEMRIEKVTAWDKNMDDLLREMSPSSQFNGRWHCLAITGKDSGWVRILNYIGKEDRYKEVTCFEHIDQCGKLKAVKEALMWFLDHSDIKKSIVGTKQEIKLKGIVYEAEIIREVK